MILANQPQLVHTDRITRNWVVNLWEHIPSQKSFFQRGEEEIQMEFCKAPKTKSSNSE